MAQLGIVGHQFQQLLGRGLIGFFEVVCSVASVIYESKHVQGNLDRSIWCAKLCAVGSRSVAIEECAGDKGPINWGIAAALACAVDGVGNAMLNESLRDSELRSQVLLGFF